MLSRWRDRSAASPLPLSSSQKHELAVHTKLALTGLILHTLTQLAHINCPWPERWQRILSIPVPGLLWAWPQLAPRIYLKYRNWIQAVVCIVFFNFPLLRKPKGIQRVLDAPATPGFFGFLTDVLKIAWGEETLEPSFVTPIPCIGSQ